MLPRSFVHLLDKRFVVGRLPKNRLTVVTAIVNMVWLIVHNGFYAVHDPLLQVEGHLHHSLSNDEGNLLSRSLGMKRWWKNLHLCYLSFPAT